MAIKEKIIKNIIHQDEELNEDESVGVTLRDYQIEAIDSWKNNNKKGFLVMATGTGKTWTAIYAALEIIKDENILLVICAPYKHLVRQWYEDVYEVLPDKKTIMISSENSNWENELKDAIFETKYVSKDTIIAISTIVSFNQPRFQKAIQKCKMNKMLIVDEAHRFKNHDKKFHDIFPYMLGVSATPSSKKNDDYGELLMEFFGGRVYNLPIEYAIENKYLVEYNYYPIYVEATQREEEAFDKYSKMMASFWRNGKCIDVEGLAKTKRARLRVIAMAEEKNNRLKWILSQITEKNHFIVYCGDGKVCEDMQEEIRHINYVKKHLDRMDIKSSQFTADENIKERMNLVRAFNQGRIDALVAIRCLDEGINIPSIHGALLLASNDDYREFIQRRGRILRTYKNEYSGEEKSVANIFDVIVLPNDNMKSFATIEIKRFYEYARLAKNRDVVLREYEDLITRYEISEEDVMQQEEMERELDE